MGMVEDAIREYSTFEDRSTDPSTPASGTGLVYFKDGVLHSIDDAGAVTEYGAAAAPGGSEGWFLIDEHVVSGTESQIDFTGIPDTYDDLIVDAYLITNRDTTSGTDGLQIRFGDTSIDTGNNYSYRARYVGGSSDTITQIDGAAVGFIDLGPMCATENQVSEHGGYGMIRIRRYADDSIWRTVQGAGGVAWNHASGQYITDGIGSWRNKADPISKVRLTATNGSFVDGFAALYGVKHGVHS